MPQQRLQVGSGVPQPGLATPAAPVDTFVKPAAGYKLEQVARGLATLEPSLGHLSDVITERENKASYEAGLAKASELSQNASDWRKAIRDGLAQPHQSPWFQAGLRERLGSITADRLNFELTAAANSDETLKNSISTQDYSNFAAQFIHDWRQQNIDSATSDIASDPNFERGMASRMDAYLSDNERTWAAQIGRRSETLLDNASFAQMRQAIRGEFQRGAIPPEKIGEEVAQIGDSLFNIGVNPKQIQRTQISAIQTSAIDMALNGDDNALHAIDLLKSTRKGTRGSTVMLFDTPEGAQAYEETRYRVASILQDTKTQQSQRNRLALQDSIDSVRRDIFQTLANDPTANVTDKFGQLNDLDPQSAVDWLDVPNKIGHWRQGTSNPATVRDLTNAIWSDPDNSTVTTGTIMAKMMKGDITPSDAHELSSQLAQSKESGSVAILREEPLTSQLQNLHDAFVGGAAGPYEKADDERAFTAFAGSLRQHYLAWRQGRETSVKYKDNTAYDSRINFVSDEIQRFLRDHPAVTGGTPAVPPAAPKDTTSRPTSTTSSRPAAGGANLASVGGVLNPLYPSLLAHRLGVQAHDKLFGGPDSASQGGSIAPVDSGPKAEGISFNDAYTLAAARHGGDASAAQPILQRYNVPNDPASVFAFVTDALHRWNIQ